MDNRNNRWLAGLSLFALFGVIALAGGRAQGTQNVLVTNTSSQPVQVAARPGTGAYIVAVQNSPSVKVLSSPSAPVSTKEVNDIDASSQVAYGFFTVPAGNNDYFSGYIQLSASTPSIVDAINVNSYATTSGEAGDFVEVQVDNGGNIQTDCIYPLQYMNHGNYTVASANTRIPVPAAAQIIIYVFRYGGNSVDCAVTYNVMYHTVRSP